MELDFFDQAEALTKHWLNEEPADDDQDYFRQIRQATWLEERYFNNLARLLGAK